MAIEWTGKLISVSRDWKTDRWQVTFDVNESSTIEQVNDIKDCEKLSIKAVKWRKKRSLDSNSYCWLLITKIADKLRTSKEEVYEMMLRRYGYLYEDDSGYITITVRFEVNMNKIPGHWMFYTGNGQWASYMMLKGSSEYNTEEMSHFIDGIVSEAKELGIETMTPDQIAKMVASWKGAGYGKD